MRNRGRVYLDFKSGDAACTLCSKWEKAQKMFFPFFRAFVEGFKVDTKFFCKKLSPRIVLSKDRITEQLIKKVFLFAPICTVLDTPFV